MLSPEESREKFLEQLYRCVKHYNGEIPPPEVPSCSEIWTGFGESLPLPEMGNGEPQVDCENESHWGWYQAPIPPYTGDQ